MKISIITKNQILSITDHLDNEDLLGWHLIENLSMRWTNGNTNFSAKKNFQEKPCILVLNIISSGPYLQNQNLSKQLKLLDLKLAILPQN